MKLEAWLRAIDYRINEASDYGWRCYGEAAHCIDSFDPPGWGEESTWAASGIFDRKTQQLYEATAHDYRTNTSYRWIDSDYRRAHRHECKERGIDFGEAYDTVRFIDLETEEDILDKTQDIVNGREYDRRVTIPVDIPDEQLLQLFKLAHEHDMTLNQYVEQVCREILDNPSTLINTPRKQD